MSALGNTLAWLAGITLLAVSAPAAPSNFVYPDTSLWHEVEVKDEGNYSISIVFETGKSAAEQERATAMLSGFRDSEDGSRTGPGGVPAHLTVEVARLPAGERIVNTILPHPQSLPVSGGRIIGLAKVHFLPGRYEVWVKTVRSSADMKSVQLKSHLVVARDDGATAGKLLQLHSPTKPCSAETNEYRKAVCDEHPRR